MLVTTEPQRRLISGAEALAQTYEDTDRQVAPNRMPEQDSWKESGRRIGRMMSHQALCRYVTRSNPRVIMETSIADPACAGFYSLTGDHKRYLVAFHKGHLPEWSIIETDKADLPVRERRGWRTVLMRLLKQRILSFRQITNIIQDHYGYSPAVWNKYWHLHVGDFA